MVKPFSISVILLVFTSCSVLDKPDSVSRVAKMSPKEKSSFDRLFYSANKEKILEAIRDVMQGRNYFDPLLMQNFLDFDNQKSSSSFAKKDLLTKREQEIIQLICDEKTTGEIAEELSISVHTVESHRSNILLKLELKNSVGLVKWAIQNEVINL